MPDYGVCWRCDRAIVTPGNNYLCSSGAWVLNGTASEAVAQFNFVIAAKHTTEQQKKIAHKEALAHGFELVKEKDIKKRKYAEKPGTAAERLEDLQYTAAQKKKLKELCDTKEVLK